MLEGIRILDFTRVVVGPIATRLLAAAGAEVIRVENMNAIDTTRVQDPIRGEKWSPDRSPAFNNMNSNKLSITLNTWHPEAMNLLKRLIAMSDVVIENFSSRVMERWGLSYETLTEIKPDIIYVSMSGFGHSGPYRDYGAMGPTAQALSGLSYMSGIPGQQPAAWGFSYLDITPGYCGTTAVLLALRHRHLTGQGQYIDLSPIECGVTFCGPAILDYAVNNRPYRPTGNRLNHPAAAPHGIYRCKGDDRWCAISIFTEDEWDAFCKVIDRSQWTNDPKFATRLARLDNQDELDGHITEWTCRFTPVEVMYQLQSSGIAAGVVESTRDRVDNDAQLEERGMFIEIEHPELGKQKVDGFAFKLSRTPLEIRTPPPLMGEHNSYVYENLLGLTPEEIQNLASEGAI
jgi:crotonobetainyl-CoA:carnitine CoA-transferase CaiB-like acyl-CoA transferase